MNLSPVSPINQTFGAFDPSDDTKAPPLKPQVGMPVMSQKTGDVGFGAGFSDTEAWLEAFGGTSIPIGRSVAILGVAASDSCVNTLAIIPGALSILNRPDKEKANKVEVQPPNKQ
jgi:hypothetical protein